MVAKKAGQFAGGFLNNPGALAAIGIVVSIITTLVIFRNDIRNFLGTTIPEAFGDINIQLPSIELPSLPEITLPSFELPSFELPSFDFTLPTIDFPSFEDVFGEPSGLDFTDVGAAAARARQEEEGAGEPEPFVTPFTGLEDVEITGGGAVFADPVSIPFAVANIEETQEEFQERAGIFAEMFADITRSTSLPGGDVIFGRQLSRESEDFADVLAEEAARSESIFAALFGNVQNPEFGA